MNSVEYFNQIAKKWQKLWEDNKIFEANIDYSRKKFFITVAFPYTNSPLHIGHGRTYLIADIYARFMRMLGFNVLFPFAFQFTGTPILSISQAIMKEDKDIIETFKNIYQVPEEELKKFTDPLTLAEYFKSEMKETAKMIGLSIDWRREFTTIDPSFISLVQWQFKKLKELGYLKTETNAVPFCPNDKFPVGMHDTKGDIEPEIDSLDVILFESNEFEFAAATTRPETIFGAVAILINPNAEYSVSEFNRRKIIVSSKSLDKIKYQINIKEINRLKGSELIGKEVINPVTKKRMKVLGSKYVDQGFGTGVVMAVPSHEPLHFLALSEQGIEHELIPVIYTPELGEVPGVYIFDLARTKNPAELKEYIDMLYRMEYHRGTMREDIVNLVPDFMKDFVKKEVAGKRVSDARKNVRELLSRLGVLFNIYEIYNGPIYCRCGSEVVAAVLNNQLFIDYDNNEWKSKLLRNLDKVNFIPIDSKKEVEKSIFSLRKRACTRSRGLGVKLPWDPSQILDSLSDSTLYTILYTISHKIRNLKLNDEFWDYLIFNKGDPNEIAKKLGISIQDLLDIKNEYLYWYPVDSRHTARDLLYNHIPYYLLHHLAILGENMLPLKIIVNGFVRVGGKKMSKSLRNIYPLSKAIKEHGVDPLRVALVATSDLYQDNEFDEGVIKGFREQLLKIRDLILNLIQNIKYTARDDLNSADLWLSSVFRNRLKIVREYYENLKFREVINELLYKSVEDIKEYIKLNKYLNKDIVFKVIKSWILMLTPIVPHLAEELWHNLDNSFVSTQIFPKEDELPYDEKSILEIEYIRFLINNVKDVEEIAKKKADKIIIYVEDSTSIDILRRAIQATENRKILKEFVEEESKDEEYLRRIYELANKLPTLIKNLIKKGVTIDEYETITRYAYYILEQLNLLELQVYSAKDSNAPDYRGKKAQALPFMPSIVII